MGAGEVIAGSALLTSRIQALAQCLPGLFGPILQCGTSRTHLLAWEGSFFSEILS